MTKAGLRAGKTAEGNRIWGTKSGADIKPGYRHYACNPAGGERREGRVLHVLLSRYRFCSFRGL